MNLQTKKNEAAIKATRQLPQKAAGNCMIKLPYAPGAAVWLSFEFLHGFLQPFNEMHGRESDGLKVHKVHGVIIPHKF